MRTKNKNAAAKPRAVSLVGTSRTPRESRQSLQPQALLFALTLFLSAGLLFVLEPMFAKMILPVFGGAPAVWNTCLVFYQAVLLAGYLYAHLSIKWLGPRRQALLHLAVLVAPWIVLPIRVPENWVPPADAFPVPWVWMLLSLAVGLPFFVVSASAPVLQAWFAQTGAKSAKDPYFLYAASNLGSLLALLGYPLVIEANLTLTTQTVAWTAGYGLLIILLGACATRLWRSAPALAAGTTAEAAPQNLASDDGASAPNVWRRLRWVLLAAIPSSLLLGVTSHLTVDIVAMPLLWVVPLALYLLSFVIVFARRPILAHRWMVRVQPYLLVAVVAASAFQTFAWSSVIVFGSLHLLAFFVTAMVCHGEMAADRPAASRLTEFYLWMSLGGVLGGLFNAIVAPIAFSTVLEYPLMIVAACIARPRLAAKRDTSAYGGLIVPGAALAAAAAVWAMHSTGALAGWRYGDAPAVKLAAMGLAACAAFLLQNRPVPFGTAVAALSALTFWYAEPVARLLHVERSFFGVLRVEYDPVANLHLLDHGRTNHGQQSLDSKRRNEPLAYYHAKGPLGDVFRAMQPQRPLKEIGVLGLGAGTIAAYGQPGERMTFYEIDPAIERIARQPEYFTYLADCPAKVDVILGDARLSLVHGPQRQFDLLIIDVFTSDSVPLHLVTREAFAEYLKRLTDRGILAAHISSCYLNLEPVLSRLAADAGLAACVCHDNAHATSLDAVPSTWVAMARHAESLRTLIADVRWQPLANDAGRLWTDDFSNIVDAIQFNKSLSWLQPVSLVQNRTAQLHLGMGATLARQGQIQEAIDHFEKALAIDPKLTEARSNLGTALASLGRFDEAVQQYGKALEIDPGSAPLHNKLAIAFAQRGEFDQAVLHWERAVELNPHLSEPHLNLGMMLYLEGRTSQALARWRQALQPCPDDVPLLCQIAKVLATNWDATVRSGPAAVDLAERAVRLSGGQDASVLDVLASAYAEAGRFPEAASTVQQALLVAGNRPDLIATLRAKLTLYQTGAAFHESRPVAPSRPNAP